MNMPPSRKEREVGLRVDAYADPEAEARRRWPDFHFEVRYDLWPLTHPERGGEIRRTVLRAFWTSADGVSRGLTHDVAAARPQATEEELAAARILVARSALFNDEYRRAP